MLNIYYLTATNISNDNHNIEMKKKIYRITTSSGSLHGLLKGQLRFLNKYYDVVGIASDTGNLKDVEEEQGIRTINIKMAREISLLQDIKSLIALYQLFRKDKPDIVHANTPKASLLSMIAAMAARVPNRIYLVTGLRFETTKGLLRFILKTMERITCSCATKVIPEGDGVKNTLIREKITSKSLEKIHNGNINGIDLTYFNRTKEVEEKASLIRKPNTFTFIFVGRLVKDKGVNELIEAFNKISQEQKDVRLILVGKFEEALDPLFSSSKEIINNNKLIDFVGYQNDIRPYLVASDVLILPSYREGFPNVILQAGAMGIPCIVTDINGCNEAIIDGKNGIIIPKQDSNALYEAMKRIKTDVDLHKNLALNSRALISSRYDQKDLWDALLNMYNSL